MRRKNDSGNPSRLDASSAQLPSVPTSNQTSAYHRTQTQAFENLPNPNAPTLLKKVTRHFQANFGTRFDKLEHDIQKDKRFLIFEVKQTPFYTKFFDQLLVELNGESPTHNQDKDKEKVAGSATAHKQSATNGTHKRVQSKLKIEIKPLDVVSGSEYQEEDSPTNATKMKRKVKEEESGETFRKSSAVEEKGKKDRGYNSVTQSQVITSHHFQAIRTEALNVKEKETSGQGKEKDLHPTGREFKRKDPLPVFRPKAKDSAMNTSLNVKTPKAAEAPETYKKKVDFTNSLRVSSGPEIADLIRTRTKTNFGSENKARSGRRMTMFDPSKYQTIGGKGRENIEEDESESENEHENNIKRQMTMSSKDNALIATFRRRSGIPIQDFILLANNVPETETGKMSVPALGTQEQPKMEKKNSEKLALKKYLTMGVKKFDFDKRVTGVVEDSADEMLGLTSPKAAEEKQKESREDLPQINILKTVSNNSINDLPVMEYSKPPTPKRSLPGRLRSAEKDRMVTEIKSIVRTIIDRTMKEITQKEMHEIQVIEQAEEHWRQETRKAEKQVKKHLRESLKKKIYDLMLLSMPMGSRTPSLFLASHKSESSLLIESVRKGIERNIQNLELEIKEIYAQFETLRRLQPEDVESVYPFEISSLSIFTLKTIPESEVRQVLTTDRLSSEMLCVFRLFYYVHFPEDSFTSIETKNQKSLLMEIFDLYQNRLKTLEIGDKPVYRRLTFKEKLKLEEFLINNKNLFTVVSDMSLKPFNHSICFYTFETLFYYGMKSYVKFMEKPREKDKNLRNSAYQLSFLMEKMGMLEGNLKEFVALQRQFEMK